MVLHSIVIYRVSWLPLSFTATYHKVEMLVSIAKRFFFSPSWDLKRNPKPVCVN